MWAYSISSHTLTVVVVVVVIAGQHAHDEMK